MNTDKEIIVTQYRSTHPGEMGRWATKKDLAKQLYRVASSGFNGHSPWGRNGLEASIDSPNTVLLLAFIDDEIVGFLMASETELELDIYIIVVAKTEKEKGVGTKLLEHLIEYGHDQKMASIILETRASNTAARNLYIKVGFKEVGLRKAYYSSPIEHAVVMQYDLRKEIPDCSFYP